MQALALWDIGLKRWNGERLGKSTPEKRPGVTVNRRDLVAVPAPDANLLWHDLHVRDVRRIEGRQQTSNVRIDIIVEGVTKDRSWTCGLEFDYANDESFYCRPLRRSEGKTPNRMPVPEEAGTVQIAFLPPMSGLAATETRLDQGAVNVRIGEGRTADVLRNLCYKVHEEEPELWRELVAHVQRLFGSELAPPRYVAERGEILMTYQENRVQLELSSSGRGLQQTLLLLAYLYANPGAVLLLDEPDAHLEILRQRQIYRLLTDVAGASGSQIIAASHSEVLLAEAAGKDMVVAFVGRPHRIDDQGSQVSKALKEIGFDQYSQAEQTAGYSTSRVPPIFLCYKPLHNGWVTMKPSTHLNDRLCATSATMPPRFGAISMASKRLFPISRAWRSSIAFRPELQTSQQSNAWPGSGGRSRTICAHRQLLKPMQGRRLPTVGARCLRRLKPTGEPRQCEKPSWTSRVH